jgi:hypothetical protein
MQLVWSLAWIVQHWWPILLLALPVDGKCACGGMQRDRDEVAVTMEDRGAMPIGACAWGAIHNTNNNTNTNRKPFRV